MSENNDGNTNLSDAEKELEQARLERQAAEKLAADNQAHADRLRELVASESFDLWKKDAFQGAIRVLGLTPYDEKKALKMLESLDGVKIHRSDDGEHTVTLNGNKSSMFEATQLLLATHPTHFKGGVPEPDKKDDRDGVKAWSDFRSREHRISWISRYGLDAYEGLLKDATKYYTCPVSKLTREQYMKLDQNEKIRAQREMGIARFEKFIAGH